MIRPLRQRHRAMVCTLAVILPVAVAVGIAKRPALPVANSLSPELAAGTADFGRVVWIRDDLWPGHRIITSLRRNPDGAAALEFAFRDLARPDVLVYLSANESVTDRLPEDSQFLGVLAEHRALPIPARRPGSGRLVLYSLADHEVVAVSNPVTF